MANLSHANSGDIKLNCFATKPTQHQYRAQSSRYPGPADADSGNEIGNALSQSPSFLTAGVG